MKNRGHQIFYYVSMIGISLAILGLFYTGYLLFWPYKTVTFKQTNNLEILNENKQLRAGEDLQYKISYCKYTDKTAIITRTIQDGVLYILPPVEARVSEGCKENATVNIATIPKAIPPGKYTMVINLQYRINPLRTVSHTLATEPFYVVK